MGWLGDLSSGTGMGGSEGNRGDVLDMYRGLRNVPTDRYNSATYGGEDYIHFDENGNMYQGPSGADEDVDRFRQLGQANPKAVQLDRKNEGRDRRFQMGSLAALEASARGGGQDMALLTQAADGQAPSRAEIMGRQASDQALQSQVRAMGQQRGPGGAAFAASQPGVAAQQASMVQGAQAARAGEMGQARNALTGAMGQARGAFGKGATGVRGQDLDVAATQADLEARNRAGNRSNEQFYENLATDVRNSDLEARHRSKEMYDKMMTARRNADSDREAQATSQVYDVASAGGGAITGVSDSAAGVKDDDSDTSDRKAKNVIPMGSLYSLNGGR